MEELSRDLREAADAIDREVPVMREVHQAAKEAFVALSALDQAAAATLPAADRHRLGTATERLGKALEAADALYR